MYNVYKCNGCKTGKDQSCLAFSAGKDIVPNACLWWPEMRNDSNWVKDCTIKASTNGNTTTFSEV